MSKSYRHWRSPALALCFIGVFGCDIAPSEPVLAGRQGASADQLAPAPQVPPMRDPTSS